MPITNDAYQSGTDGSDFYFMVLSNNATGLKYGSYFGGQSNEHVDGGTSRFSHDGNIYQAVCAGCGNLSFPTTNGAWATNKNAWRLYRNWDIHGIVGGGDSTHFLRIYRLHNGETRKYGNIRKLLYNPILDKYFRSDPKWEKHYINTNLYHLWHGKLETRSGGYLIRTAVVITGHITGNNLVVIGSAGVKVGNGNIVRIVESGLPTVVIDGDIQISR